MTLEDLLARLWRGYLAITPQAARIHALLAQRGGRFEGFVTTSADRLFESTNRSS